MKILALDGGGVFGSVQATILQRVNALEKFDCFVGTSIGSALAAAIVTGNQSKVDQQFFHKWMPVIFKRNVARLYWPFNSRYSDEGLNKALRDVFRGALLRDAQKPLFITAANVGSRTLKVFSPQTDNGWMLWEVVRAATAAETYFPSWKGYADGGVFANNPSMVAVSAACKVLKVKLEDVEVLSIGTGQKPAQGGRGPLTMLGWGMWLIEALLEGASDAMHDYFVNSLPVKKYTRIQFASEADWKMDSPKDMMKAQRAWAQDVERAITIVKAF
jgi:patatin-like phospholipase/acyl hydrolase